MNNTIRISCNLNNLKVVRSFVTDYLNPFGLSDIVQNQIILAVDEITANIMIHSNKKDESKFMKLAISQQAETLLFEFSDQGVPFDPGGYKPPNVSGNAQNGRKGGMGIAMVKKIMDRVEYHRDGVNNIWRLYKTIS